MIIDAVIVLFALVATTIVYFFIRDRQLIGGMKGFLNEGKYASRAIPPIIVSPFTREKTTRVVCYDGQIKPDMPYTLMLGSRAIGEGKDKIHYQYIGFYFPPQVNLDEEWLNGWKQKVAERGDQWASDAQIEKTENKWGIKGPPDSLPIRATRVDGGVILAWNGLHIREHIQARINDVLDTL